MPAGLASDGEGWLSLGLSSHEGGPSVRLHGTRVSAEGVVLDSPGFVIDYASHIADVAVSFDGTHYVVAWAYASIPSGSWTISLRRVATDGTLVGESATLGWAENPSPGSLEVASGPDSNLVVWCGSQTEPTVTTGCSWVQLEGTTVVASDSHAVPDRRWRSERGRRGRFLADRGAVVRR